MRRLSDSDFVELWEKGAHLHPIDRALLALQRALPKTSYEALADWPLGRINRALAELRCSCFGSSLQGWAVCPACSEKMEFDLDARELLQNEPASGSDNTIRVNGYEFRLPTSRDLAQAASEIDPEIAALRLLEACRLDQGEARTWSEEEIEAIESQMASADPLADATLTLRCEACGQEWEEALDLTTFVWVEAEARAKRLLSAVHTLASAYGWSEAEVFALSDTRRAFYLEMVQA